VKKEIEDAIEKGKTKSKLLNVKIKFIKGYPALKTDPNGQANVRMKKVMSLVQGIPEDEIKTIGSSGSTDMGCVSEILNTNDIITHGIGWGGSNEHGVNENVRLKDIIIFIKELIAFLCADL
jgi:succinyl-diaminopimelate desuccinylase